jgi:alkylation response protein AidB-like acyl-CoA dehydrogenase
MKSWITNATVADAGVIFAYTDRSQKHRGMSAFYAELDQPGVCRRDPDKLGAHSSPPGAPRTRSATSVTIADSAASRQ